LATYISKISSAVNTVIYWCTVILTAGFSCLIFTSVLSRYFLDFSILYSQEVSKLLFIWACFFAATITYKKKAHIRFEFIDRFLNPSLMRWSDLSIHFLSLVFFLVIFFKSISYVTQIWETYFPLIGISQGWLYVSVIVSTFILSIHAISFILEDVYPPTNGEKVPNKEDEGGKSC